MLASALVAILVVAGTEPPAALAVAGDPVPAGAASGAVPVLAPAWLDLEVNGAPRGTFLVHLGGGDAWIAAEDLEQAGVRVEGGERLERSGRSLVSLRSLAPGVSFDVDAVNLVVRVVAAKPLLGQTTMDLMRTRRPAGLLHREATSAYLNWSAFGDTEERRSGAGELGIAAGRALLASGATVDRVNGLVRGLTTGSWEDRERLLRWSAGDVVVSATDPLAGNAIVLGGSAGKDFSLDPYLQQAEYPRTSVFAATPSTLEVWVDDTLVRRTPVQPGTIDLENVPVNVGGLSQIRTVLRDPFGRETSASTYALMGSTTLAPGLVDWGVSAGARRLAYGTESFDYGAFLGQAHVRAGVTRLLTLGGRVEAGQDLVSGGPSLSLATPIAEVEATVAASSSGSDTGAAAYVAMRRTGRRAGLVAQLRWDSGRYANGSLVPSADRALARASLTGSVAVTQRLTFLGEVSAERWRDAGEFGRGVARLTYALPRGFLSSLSVSRSLSAAGPDATEVLLSLSMLLPGRTIAEVGAGTGSRGTAHYSQASVSRQMLPGPDVGFRVAAREGDGALAEGELRAQNQYVWGDALHQQVDPWTGSARSYSSAQVASGLVLIDGHLLVTRPVDGAYALVKLDDAPGVRVMLQGQDAGRTDRNGELFVTGLLPYYGNRISIVDSDLPLDYRVDEVERTIAPRRRGGSVERFRVARELSVSGRLALEVDGAAVTPELGEVAVEVPGRRVVSPIGYGGVFWLEAIPPGAHEALVKWEGRLCRFTFEIPDDTPGVVNLGTVRCNQML